MSATELTAVVAVPVRNECERIGACMDALIHQFGVPTYSYGILLFLNNCSDGTDTIVADIASRSGTPIRILREDYCEATAGWARRAAMEAAASWLSDEGADDGIILTTDADSRVGPNWISNNLACLSEGADAVAGRIVLDHDDAALLPPALHARGRLEATYEALLTEIGARLDPEPSNPWPCHWTASGASLSVRRSLYKAVGGMPALSLGEDRAFVEALRAIQGRIRHSPDIVVVTSGRLDGRAIGGASETMKLRCADIDCLCDRRLEPVHLAIQRVGWRRLLRRFHKAGVLEDVGRWAAALHLGIDEAKHASRAAAFTKAFAEIEAKSAVLGFHPLRPSELPPQITLARLVVRYLDRQLRRSPSEHRDDIDPFELGEQVARRGTPRR